MASASFILAINMFVAALFALAFLIVALTNRSDRAAGWFAIAYGFGIIYIITEFLLPMQDNPRFANVVGFVAFLGAVTAVLAGIARRYRQSLPALPILVLVLLSVIANWTAWDLPRDNLIRLLAYQTPYAIVQILTGLVIFNSHRRQPVDLGLMVLFILSGLQFLAKPFIAILAGGTGGTADAYLNTTYALFSQSMGAVLQVATGLLALMIMVRDMLIEITARSETDPLSGLLNRRGFEDRALSLLAWARADRRAITLITADLDAFKSINDAYGHPVGDSVIAAFARILSESADASAVAARMGGEEFVVLLPNTALAPARLFAEALRVRFGTTRLPELPEGRFCTASFGVAEASPLESLSDLRRRADAALYAAKRGGRDRVEIAGETGLDVMEDHPMNFDRTQRRA